MSVQDDYYDSLEALSPLAERIRVQAELLEQAAHDSVSLARNCGTALIQAERKSVEQEKQVKSIQKEVISRATENKRLKEELSEYHRKEEQAAIAARNDERFKQAELRKSHLAASDKERISVASGPTGEPFAVLTHRSPGDVIRYLARQVMTHADGIDDLAGVAMAMNMVADNVDRLPQDDHAR